MLRYVVHPSILVTVVRVGFVRGTALDVQVTVGSEQSRYRGHRRPRVMVAEWSGPHASAVGNVGLAAIALQVLVSMALWVRPGEDLREPERPHAGRPEQDTRDRHVLSGGGGFPEWIVVLRGEAC